MTSDLAGNEGRSKPAARSFGDRFAETSVKGALTRGALAWVLITPVVVVAKILWSGTTAAVIGLVAVTVYVVVAMRFRARHRRR